MDLNSRLSILNSVSRFEFFQPITMLAATRYCGASTTYSFFSPKISKASSRIVHSSGKIGQAAGPFDLYESSPTISKPVLCTLFPRESLGNESPMIARIIPMSWSGVWIWHPNCWERLELTSQSITNLLESIAKYVVPSV